MIESMERYVYAAISAGATVDPAEARREMDDWLVSKLEMVDREKDELRRALGVGR